jgi:hypothetical protein
MPNSVIYIEDDAFSGCTSLTSIIIPNSVTEIGTRAFNECTSLTSIIIPISVTEIGGGAFSDCTSLTSVTFEGRIASADFGNVGYFFVTSPFFGDLRTKYFAANGGIGTYTTTMPVGSRSVWTKQ